MKMFLHDLTRVRIINDTQEWQGTPAEFQALEPLYPGLPVGMVTRYQTPENSYVTDGSDMFPDVFDALGYCDNLGNYPSYTPRGFTAFYIEDTAQKLPFGTGGTLTFPAITGNPNAITIDCATSGHDHDSDYAPLTHDHDSDYAALTHAHAADYAPLTHDHDSDYADIAHAHAADYAPLTHDHDADYVDIDNATATPTASKIPIADVSNKLAIGWLPTTTTIGDPGSDSYVPTEQAVREGLAAVSSGGLPNGYNSITYAYKDAATVTVAANGQAVTADGSVTHLFTAAIDVSLATDLDTGSEAANTLYYLWIGTVTGTVTLKFSASATSPTGLTDPVRLRGAVRNNASSNIIPFFMTERAYVYDADIAMAGSDVTEVYDATNAAFADVTCSAFVPAGARCVVCKQENGGGSVILYIREKGAAASNGEKLMYGMANSTQFTVMVNAAGVFQAKCSISATLRISVKMYDL